MAIMDCVVSLIALRKLGLNPAGMVLLVSSEFDVQSTRLPKPAREMTTNVEPLTSNCSFLEESLDQERRRRRV